MLENFKAYIDSQNLANYTDNLLLAVSGGIDSVSMAHLFHQADYKFDMAHCNFSLRGKESEQDQVFVEKLAEKYGCHIHTIRFETEKYAQEKGVSIQMAARELRYNWFEELAENNNYSHIAVAHNRNDIVETILINLIRGTGLKGLTGIKPLQGRIIRPLLFATRAEIQNYAEKEKLEFREDSSNQEIKYHRNLIRHKIQPLIEQINPSFTDTVIEESEIFHASYSIYQRELNNIRRAITISNDDRTVLSITKIVSFRLSAPVIFDILSPYGFTYTDSKNLLDALDRESGKKFFSEKYVMLKDRNTLIIEKIKKHTAEEKYLIDRKTESVSEPVQLKIRKISKSKDYQLPGLAKKAAIDYDKLIFPLQLRHWQKGDFFIPLGLNGKKKLSDFFIDHKIDLLEKDKIWILLSDSKIVWVLGQQIDDRFKVTEATRNIMQIDLID